MILIQCVKSKKQTPTKARRLYDSVYWRSMRDYAEATLDDWRIISAKHGLLDPDTVIEPYDEFGLSDKQCARIADELVNIGVSHVDIIGGKQYTTPLKPEIRERGITVTEICEGLQIGERIHELQLRTEQLKHHTL